MISFKAEIKCDYCDTLESMTIQLTIDEQLKLLQFKPASYYSTILPTGWNIVPNYWGSDPAHRCASCFSNKSRRD